MLERRRTAEETWWLELAAPAVAAEARPGQFVMAGFGTDQVGAPFLPRPFSIGWRGGDGRIGLLVRAFGAGTRRLAALRPGDDLLLLGPLGRPFRPSQHGPTICVAGGVGLAPFLFLGSEARCAGREIRLLYGERSAPRVFDPGLVAALTGVEPEVFTQDGSLGRPGTVLDGIAWDAGTDAGTGVAERPVLLGCGPAPMLAALARLAAGHGADLQVSVEEHMGCGVGTCQGCVVRTADGRWVKSCTEGPVFDARELAWPA
ncbi:MAG: dihydroorotate dehydrogenase electron transfer subunit [Gemmatimonadota bacterium]|nr:dihydroorotate dehydrogenase electron transfer subunit [Gemmatimonadota bacterium]